MKKIAFTIADANNKKYADMMIKSLHYFHPELECLIYDENAVGEKVNYYRSTPLFAKELLNKYDFVLKLDSDQIITGDLSHLWEGDYDFGGVINFSRSDVKEYGIVSVLDIPPDQYFNCGLVGLKSKKFANHWWDLCNSYHFNSYQYKEQDLLNIMIHYGTYNVRCYDKPELNYNAWHGLLSKGEWHKMELIDGKLVLPKAKDKYPESDKEIKVMHFAGGQANQNKMNYRIYCNEEVIKFIDNILK